MEEEIDDAKLGECIFALLKQQPWLVEDAQAISPHFLHHEAAAQSALLDLALGRLAQPQALPLGVRALMGAFLTSFMMDLSRGSFVGQTWRVPANADPAAQALCAIAQMLAQAVQKGDAPH